MKSITGRIAHKEFDQFWNRNQAEQPFFTSDSLLWKMNLPGIAGLAALRVLLRQAAVEQGERGFPYCQAANNLLRQQMMIFGGWSISGCGSARHWVESVVIDLAVRECLLESIVNLSVSKEEAYAEYLRFGMAMGLEMEKLPATFAHLTTWANINLEEWNMNNFRHAALRSITKPSPVFWPVNIALIFYLLPDKFWDNYGDFLGSESRRLVEAAALAITKLSCSLAKNRLKLGGV